MGSLLLKNRIASFLALATALLAPAVHAGLAGAGTSGNPYQIASYADLKAFASKVNDNGETNAWGVLTADITATDTLWTPIGTADMNGENLRYAGTFDGQGHVISGLSNAGMEIDFLLSDAGLNVGLFGILDIGGVVRNIRMENVCLRGFGGPVGGVAGYNMGMVENASVSGSVSECEGTRSTRLYVKVYGYKSFGGVAGGNFGVVTNCRSAVAVLGLDRSHVGGVVGFNESGGPAGSKITVSCCYSSGSVLGGNESYVGGVVGYNEDGTVACNYNTGTVSGGSEAYVGGVVGYNVGYDEAGTVTCSYNTGTISGGSGANVGGVVGNNEWATMSFCYNTGQVTGGGEAYKGSVAGVSKGARIPHEDEYSIHYVECGRVSGCYYPAGFDLGAFGQIVYSTNTNLISHVAALTTDQFRNASSFIDWDFDAIWAMGPEAPLLRAFPPTPTVRTFSVGGASVTVVPGNVAVGLYYGLCVSTNLAAGFAEPAEWTLATNGVVVLERPMNPLAEAEFYKIKVSTTTRTNH